ncbi:MAG: hypothetical protein ACRC2T_13265 [Thermoguttaceae bacterium]
MDRLLKLSGTALLYIGASMFLAELIFLAYLKFAWGINSNKVNQMIAIAQGIDIFQTEKKLREAVEDKIQQMSYDEVLKIRAERGLQGDYGKMISGQSEKALLADVRRFEDQKKQFDQSVLNFEKRLTDLKKEQESAGFNELVLMMESLDAKLSKKQILQMIENKEQDRVVLILRAMKPVARKKLLNVLKEDSDVKELADIFRRVGDGEPESKLVKEAQK